MKNILKSTLSQKAHIYPSGCDEYNKFVRSTRTKILLLLFADALYCDEDDSKLFIIQVAPFDDIHIYTTHIYTQRGWPTDHKRSMCSYYFNIFYIYSIGILRYFPLSIQPHTCLPSHTLRNSQQSIIWYKTLETLTMHSLSIPY